MPPQDFTGTLDIKLTASDGASEVADIFQLSITATNDAPAVAVAQQDQSVSEDTAWSYTIPGSTFTDPDGDVLSYSAMQADGSALPFWLSFDASTQTFSGTPPQDFNGALTLKVTASDGAITVSDEFVLTVTATNDAPVVTVAQADQSVAENTTWTYTVSTGTFSDVDGDSLTMSASLANGSALPAWISFDASTQTFSGTPPQDFNGALALKVTASDGSVTASDEFALTVIAAQSLATAGDDILTGTTNVDVISGLGGADQINGGAGDDYLYGDEGDDTIYGDAGADTLSVVKAMIRSMLMLMTSLILVVQVLTRSSLLNPVM
ncbi:putative Ig domain-containing protein [Pseudovibrio sp. Tun.PSC04-5.I4]|uniref:putative Ig domain-containing protein n=1 Tax=Pseudovibrio sp. Tun.PSC04-5.I4 TaxID=1798213 RepID=UPI001FCBEB02|nr:putative Ig domain-containing protein [Pseudovibrio sp. Tun.PSC04-5.I4]